MRNTFAALMLAAAASTAVAAVSTSTAAASTAGASTATVSTAAASTPGLEWLEMRHDFGAFSENDGDAVCDFRFVNHSDMPVVVVSVRTSCGCTTASVPRDPVMPGDTAVVTAVYNPVGRPGRFDKKVVVETTAKPSKTELHVCGVVIGDPTTLGQRYPVKAGPLLLPGEMLALGKIDHGSLKSTSFEVYNASHEPVAPAWENVPPYLHITTTTPEIPAGEQGVYSIVLYADKRVPYGLLTDTLNFIPAPGEQPVAVDVVANVVEDFSKLTSEQLDNAPTIAIICPRVLDFGTYDPDSSTPITRTFTIINRGRSTLIIRRVYSAEDSVDVQCKPMKLKPGKEATVTVTVNPSNINGNFLDGRVTIISNDPAHPVTHVRISAMPEITE